MKDEMFLFASMVGNMLYEQEIMAEILDEEEAEARLVCLSMCINAIEQHFGLSFDHVLELVDTQGVVH